MNPALSDPARELLELMNEHGGRSGGRPWKREDAYEGRNILVHPAGPEAFLEVR